MDNDGKWSSLEEPCVSIGETRKLIDSRFSVWAVPAGRTLLYTGGEDVSQLDLASGESEVVLRSDHMAPFGWIRNSIVYYETDGRAESRNTLDLIVDHGAASTSRYERISPRPNRVHAGLLTTPAGVYWWTSISDLELAEYWRWDPDTDTVERYELDTKSLVRTDDDSFFYVDSRDRLVVRPQLPGPIDLVIDPVPDLPMRQPIGIDGDELFYVNHLTEAYYDGDLVARGADGIERVLATGRYITGGAIDPSYVYFTEDCGIQDGGPFESRCQNLYRVPRAGGPVQTVFEGEVSSAVFDVTVDRCNVYWQQFTADGGALYGREITP